MSVTVDQDPGEECDRCGSSTTWQDCEHCDEYGMDGHDCGEDCCNCLHPEDNMTCQYCGGHGGWLVCLSSQGWCDARAAERGKT